MQGWLELATGGGQAARIFVLCDDPQAVTLPASPDGKSGAKEGEQALNHDLGDFLGIAHVDSHYTAMGRCQVFEFTIW